MLTLRSAAGLLTAAASVDHLAPIAALLGCDTPPAPLDAAARDALGIPSQFTSLRVARGPGALRALLAESDADEPLRDGVSRLASRLTARAPHLLWVLLVAERGAQGAAIAAWSADRVPPRVAALVVDRRRIVDSDAETVCALVAASGAADVLTHARWLDVLGRESLTRRFYRVLESVVVDLGASAGGGAPDETRHELALLYVSRLLFLSFLEAKGWLNAERDFLARRFDDCVANGGRFHRRVLLPLFFGTLNTPVAKRAASARAFGRVPFLNGGLFARSPLERQWRATTFDDEHLGRVFGELLGRYRFTAREDRVTWSEAAVDPEMLGRAFESLMASRERRASGSYYTPQALVEHVTVESLSRALSGGSLTEDAVRACLAGDPVPAVMIDVLRKNVESIRVLDPACGSGAFLVHVLERLGALLATLGDARPTSALRRAVLTRSIFGVDVNPTAVWLCELRLWLSVVIETDEDDPTRVPPLPNLDRHVRVGDSLGGGAFVDGSERGAGRLVARLRGRYARAVGTRKRTLARALDREERRRAVDALDLRIATAVGERRELMASLRGRDLFGERRAASAHEQTRLGELRAQIRELRRTRTALGAGGALPFSFAAHFADVAAAGGFDLVLGNPPWVRLHRIPRATREALRDSFVVYRDAAWQTGAAGAGAGRGFAAQVDLAALFAERSLSLLRVDGVLALLMPTKLWRSLAGGGVRTLLTTGADLLAVEDWSESRPAFDAAVYPSVVIARRRGSAELHLALEACVEPASSQPEIAAAVHRRDDALRWMLPSASLPLDPSPGSPWLLVPPAVRSAFDRLRERAVPLSESCFGRPLLGVKCGCNEAFVVHAPDGEGALAHASSGARAALIERRRLRPLLRGETVSAWTTTGGDERILWTHDESDAPLDELPLHARRWLAPYRSRLAERADARSGRRWWSLFRTEAARSATPRVVWSDFGRTPRATVLHAGDRSVPLNSCYVARCPTLDDALALAALLNGPVAAAWLDAIAEPARGGYHRYLGWTVALLPIPRDWQRATRLLAPLALRALAGERVAGDELAAQAARAYRVRLSDIAPLLQWTNRS